MGFNCFVLFWWRKSSTMLKNGYFVESKLSVETHSLFPIYIPIHPSYSHLISSFKLLFLICNRPTLFPWTSTRSEKVTEKIVRIFHCFFLQDTQSNHTSTWFSRDRFPSGNLAIRMVKSHYRNIWLNCLWTLSLSVQNSDRFHGWFIYSMFYSSWPLSLQSKLPIRLRTKTQFWRDFYQFVLILYFSRENWLAGTLLSCSQSPIIVIGLVARIKSIGGAN